MRPCELELQLGLEGQVRDQVAEEEGEEDESVGQETGGGAWDTAVVGTDILPLGALRGHEPVSVEKHTRNCVKRPRNRRWAHCDDMYVSLWKMWELHNYFSFTLVSYAFQQEGDVVMIQTISKCSQLQEVNPNMLLPKPQTKNCFRQGRGACLASRRGT